MLRNCVNLELELERNSRFITIGLKLQRYSNMKIALLTTNIAHSQLI